MFMGRIDGITGLDGAAAPTYRHKIFTRGTAISSGRAIPMVIFKYRKKDINFL
jgi:hypothetical protein